MSLEVIYNLVVESESRATIVDNGIAGTKTRFLVKDKEAIMREVKKSELGFPEICMYLAQRGKAYNTWSSRFYSWNKDWESGKLDIGLAIAVQRKKQGKTYKTNPIHEVLQGMVNEGRSLSEIESCFAIAFERIKDDVTKTALNSVETILKARGLTLEDLRNVL